MKKHIISLLAVCLLVACTTDDSELRMNYYKGTHTLSASIEQERSAQNPSRVSVKDDNSVQWEESDQIGVYGSITKNALFACKQLQGSNATFTGNLSKVDEEIVFAYYPYQKDVTLDGSTLRMELPTEYSYTGSSNAPMIGIKNAENQFTFKHLCGLMRITLGSLPADAERFVIKSVGEDAPSIAGEGIVENIEESDAILKLEKGGSTSISYRLESLATDTDLRHFFVPLPVGTYEKLEVSLYGKDKEEPYFTRSTSNVTIKRAGLLNMPIMNGTTGENYVLNKETKVVAEDVASHINISPDDNFTLIYGKDVKEAEIPKVGEVVISRPQTNLPSGFLGKVTGVNKNEDGSWIVKTEYVHFSEAFDHLYIDENIELTPENSAKSDSRATTGISNRYFQTHVSLLNDDGSIRINGTIGVAASLRASIQIDKQAEVFKTHFEVIMGARTDMKYSLNTLSVPVKDGKKAASLAVSLPAWDTIRAVLADGLLPVHINAKPSYSCSTSDDIEGIIHLDEENYFCRNAWTDGEDWFTPRKEDMYSADYDHLENSKWEIEKLSKKDVFKGTLTSTTSVTAQLHVYNSDSIYGKFTPTIKNTFDGTAYLEKDKLKNSIFTSETKSSGNVAGKKEWFLISFNNVKKLDLEYASRSVKKYWKIIPAKFPLKLEMISRSQSRGTSDTFSATVKAETEMGILKLEDYRFNLVLLDNKDNELSVSPEFSYNEDEKCDVSHTFENLQSGNKYKAYLRVKHPLLKDFGYTEQDLLRMGVVDLKEDSIIISLKNKKNSIREVLERIYNDCGGKNWGFQKNWCTDAPVAEWAGVNVLDDGTYQFDFMWHPDNKLTGKFSIMNCDESILLPYNRNWTDCGYSCLVEDVYLENCSSLKFEGAVNTVFPAAKTIYINNIKIKNQSQKNDERRGVNEVEPIFAFHDHDGNDNIEKIEIRNCKEIGSVNIEYIKSLKSIVLENLDLCKFDNSMSANERISINDCPNLSVISINDICWDSSSYMRLFNITADEVKARKIYTDIEEENNIDSSRLSLINSKVNNLSAKDCRFDLEQSEIGRLHAHKCRIQVSIPNPVSTSISVLESDSCYIDLRRLSALEMNIKDSYLLLTPFSPEDIILISELKSEKSPIVLIGENGKVSITSLEINGSFSVQKNFDNIFISKIKGYNGSFGYEEDDWSNFLFNKFKGLKEIDLENFTTEGDAIFSGCEDLESIKWNDGGPYRLFHMAQTQTELIDIRQTPSLKYFEFNGDVEQLLFDEHFNYINATCHSSKLLQEFPSFYNPDAGGVFNYDRRFFYNEEWDEKTGEIILRTDDKKRGWWYHGEPNKREHKP